MGEKSFNNFQIADWYILTVDRVYFWKVVATRNY